MQKTRGSDEAAGKPDVAKARSAAKGAAATPKRPAGKQEAAAGASPERALKHWVQDADGWWRRRLTKSAVVKNRLGFEGEALSTLCACRCGAGGVRRRWFAAAAWRRRQRHPPSMENGVERGKRGAGCKAAACPWQPSSRGPTSKRPIIPLPAEALFTLLAGKQPEHDATLQATEVGSRQRFDLRMFHDRGAAAWYLVSRGGRRGLSQRQGHCFCSAASRLGAAAAWRFAPQLAPFVPLAPCRAAACCGGSKAWVPSRATSWA